MTSRRVEIRSMRHADSAAAREIERAGGERFRSVGLSHVADHEPFSVDELSAYVDGGRAWVATAADGGEVIGYVLADLVDGNAHIEQVSVRPERQGEGIGASLVDEVRAWGGAAGRSAVTLTTFDDVPWNRPLYEHLGFTVMDDADIGPELRALCASEAAHGLDPAQRVCMRLEV